MSSAPIGYTCPDVDSGQASRQQIESLVETLTGICPLGEQVETALNDILDECANIDKEFESLRDSNSQLRSWGNREDERAHEAEVERDSFFLQSEEKISDLQSDMREAAKSISALEDQVEDLIHALAAKDAEITLLRESQSDA